MTATDLWPPSGPRSELLARLAAMIDAGGAAHFLDAPVARADAHDVPEASQATATAVERVLVRLLWLAHVDLDVAIDDQRRFDPAPRRASDIRWIATTAGVARFQIAAIGNDDVVGLLSHEVGLAYAAWQAGAAAYRDAELPPPSERDGSIAAIYLGLGVLATNAALEGHGGLGLAAAIYLLAIQAVLRDEPIAAHATLRERIPAHLVEAVAALAPHREAIAAHLGVDLHAPRAALVRDPAPPPVAARPEPEPTQRCAGMRTYRIRTSNIRAGVVLGALASAGLGSVALAVGVAVPVFGALVVAPIGVGAWLKRRRYDECPRCLHQLPPPATRCPGCGATIAGRVASTAEMDLLELEADDDGVPPAPDDLHATGAPTGR